MELTDESSMQLFIFILISSLCTPLWASPCGTEGTIEERIKECAVTKGNFSLVSRGEDGSEVYKDTKSGLLWSSRIQSEFNHYGSQKVCASELLGELPIKNLRWRLPTLREYEQASVSGIKNSLPNMDHWYWTSTPVKRGRGKRYRKRRGELASAYMWGATEEVSGTGSLIDSASVRCVSKE